MKSITESYLVHYVINTHQISLRLSRWNNFLHLNICSRPFRAYLYEFRSLDSMSFISSVCTETYLFYTLFSYSFFDLRIQFLLFNPWDTKWMKSNDWNWKWKKIFLPETGQYRRRDTCTWIVPNELIVSVYGRANLHMYNSDGMKRHCCCGLVGLWI